MNARENREGTEYVDSEMSDLRSVYKVKWLGNNWDLHLWHAVC